MIKQTARGVVQEMTNIIELDEDVQQWLKDKRVIQKIVRLKGDASNRRYYRATTSDGSLVVMKTPPFSEDDGGIRFLNVHQYLRSVSIRVPEVFDFDAERGLIVLEDLGDDTLLYRLTQCDNLSDEIEFFRKAIEIVLDLQFVEKTDELKKTVPLRFDFEKLNWEVSFTLEQFFDLFLKQKWNPTDRELVANGFAKICKTLDEQPQYLVHRDYHSRNLMWFKNDLVVIDFQDARMGPAQYDLVSLLRDSYYQLPEVEVEAAIAYYLDQFKKRSGKVIDPKEFRYIFDIMSVQRNFKAIGSFASFVNRKGDYRYLKFIGNTFENIRRTLLKYSEFKEMREGLSYYYYF